VSQAFRGRSIGTHLLQAIVSIAKEHNCKQVRWLVSSWNKAAIAFYQKMGAVIEPVDITCILHLDNK
jgi:ribosomal protein S18 acetylase RimI-like enzyme